MNESPLISEYADDPDMAEIVEDFTRGLGDTISRLRGAVEQRDLTLIRRIGHQMKGAGGGYGFPSLSIVGADLEEAVNINNDLGDEILVAVDAFISTCERARASYVG